MPSELLPPVPTTGPVKRAGRRRWGVLGLVLLLLVGAVYVVARPLGERGPSALGLQGTLLQADGERFVMAGASAYFLPFYEGEDGGRDDALAATTQRSYERREAVFERMRASGVNTVRVPVALSGYQEDVYGLGGQEGYLDRLREVVGAAAEQDIRTVVGWWDSHSQGDEWLDTYREVLPMMADVREALRPWPGVVFEPFNEPHDVTWEQWEPVMSDVVRFWREDLDYEGVLLLDTIDYSWSFDPEVAQRMIDLDARLLEQPRLVFANHRYANDNSCFCGEERQQWVESVGTHVGTFPIVGTEYGRWTGPDFQPQPRWNAEFAAHVADVAVPAGLNGYLAFVWDWVDENSMTEDDGERLNAYGQLVADEVFREHGGGA